MERGSSPVAALVELIGHHAAAVHDVHLDLGLVVVIGREGLVRVQPLLQRGRVRVSWTACKLLHVESLVCLTAMEETRGPKVIFFFKDLSLLPETRAPKEHFKLVFGSGNSDLAKIRPLKIWTSWISPWVPPYGILPRSGTSTRTGSFEQFVVLLIETQWREERAEN